MVPKMKAATVKCVEEATTTEQSIRQESNMRRQLRRGISSKSKSKTSNWSTIAVVPSPLKNTVSCAFAIQCLKYIVVLPPILPLITVQGINK